MSETSQVGNAVHSASLRSKKAKFDRYKIKETQIKFQQLLLK